ncbi:MULTISPECIES: peptidase M50 [Campylobacter]|uniref:peptidase M50 n=1 Tax=Campylobacter TaxID=194 RepID=UPI001475D731|nr:MULTISPECIES: peptidase M50 [unclassified Campylobacter]MBE3022194.1 peptidase M50 [Campylobacter sp. 7477a]MBE3609115.1 peptidase M50 [Campylobacter sp. RM12916]
MLLNTFAPPFKLVGGYFIVGILFLIVSIFAFLMANFDTPTAFTTAGFVHIYLVGFVMSIIIGSLYQLTSVILEKPFFTINGAILNLTIYVIATLCFGFGLVFDENSITYVGAFLLFASLMFFCVTYFLSFIKNQKRNFAATALLCSSVFLFMGICLGTCLFLSMFGFLNFDFELLLRYHVYFVLGFIFFIIVGVASVLLPMFALVHDLKFILSRTSLIFYVMSGVLLCFDMKFALLSFVVAALCFILEALLILKKRVRKAFDYWNINVFISLVAFVFFCAFINSTRIDIAVFFLFFGFLYAFIVAHLYKIAPFLIWYHYIAPFVGKTKVPLLDDMVVKKPAYIAIFFNVAALVAYVFDIKYIALVCLLISTTLVAFNVVHIFKFIKFGVNHER